MAIHKCADQCRSKRRSPWLFAASTWLLLVWLREGSSMVASFSMHPTSSTRGGNRWNFVLWSTSPQPPSPPDNDDTSFTTTMTKTWDTATSNVSPVLNEIATLDDEGPAGIVGAEFFGGDKRKQEFYDPVAEREAAILERQNAAAQSYSRFADRAAFTDDSVAAIAQSLQLQINRLLLPMSPTTFAAPAVTDDYTYASNVQWSTPLSSSSKNPLKELESARSFYRQIHVAIIAGSTSKSNPNNAYDLRWEISVQWPAIWEPRIVLTGTSSITVSNSRQIVSQVDTLDADLIPTIQAQILPRFWDLYHIGMTPAAESLPPLPSSGSGGGGLGSLFRSYTLQDYPPRLVSQPTQYDLGGRDESNAAMLPNHAFSGAITTMGPTKQRYTPITGVQVQLVPVTVAAPPAVADSNDANGSNLIAGESSSSTSSAIVQPQRAVTAATTTSRQLLLQWQIPVATEYASNAVLALPGIDPEIASAAAASCRYTLCPRRKVATVPYGGYPQDAGITDLRKRLYEQVVRDGLRPKMDESGRPIFFFVMNTIKACYSEDGLGMAVYEWRPQFTKPNQVGIELEL